MASSTVIPQMGSLVASVVVIMGQFQRPGMLSLDILEGLFGGPISCVPLPEPPLLAQPENVIAARMAKLSAASVD